VAEEKPIVSVLLLLRSPICGCSIEETLPEGRHLNSQLSRSHWFDAVQQRKQVTMNALKKKRLIKNFVKLITLQHHYADQSFVMKQKNTFSLFDTVRRKLIGKLILDPRLQSNVF
jgi:hypothetical protein